MKTLTPILALICLALPMTALAELRACDVGVGATLVLAITVSEIIWQPHSRTIPSSFFRPISARRAEHE